MNNKNQGFLAQNKVYIEGLHKLYGELQSLVGDFNADLFDRKIEDQLSSCGSVSVLAKDADSFVETSFDKALLRAPCEIFFNTGLDLCCSAVVETPIEISLNVKSSKGKSCPYVATFHWHIQQIEENGEERIRDIFPVPYIENLSDVEKIVAPILGVTGGFLWKQLRKSYILDGEWDVTLGDGECKQISFIEEVVEDGVIRLETGAWLQDSRCPAIYKVLPINFFCQKADLQSLAEMAQEEEAPCKWNFFIGGELVKGHFCGLGHYLEQVFSRLCDDERFGCAAFVREQDKLYFCTGLISRKTGDYIYGVCAERDSQGLYQRVSWIEEHELQVTPPAPANWTRDPSALICQHEKLVDLEARVNFDHILFHESHSERFSKNFFVTRAGQRVFNSTSARSEILKAISYARKMVQANYRYVIPGFYQGKISLMMPMCLDGSEHPNAYLVLVENAFGMYDAPTLLTPSMVYYNARAVTPQDLTVWEDGFFSEIRFQQVNI